MKQNPIKRGDIYYADLNPVVGSEQGDNRPVLIAQNDTGNEHSPTVIVAPLTRNLRKNPLPTHVMIPRSCGLDVDSLALVEQIRTIDCSRLSTYIGRIGNDAQASIDKALSVCVGIEHRRAPKGEMFMLSLCSRCERDFRYSGYVLVKKGWQEFKEDCDFCHVSKGLNFGIFNSDKG